MGAITASILGRSRSADGVRGKGLICLLNMSRRNTSKLQAPEYERSWILALAPF